MNGVRSGHYGLFLGFLSLTISLSVFSMAQAKDLEQGQKYFEGKCARCHEKDGTGNPKMAKILKTPLAKINLHRKEVVNMSIYQIESMIDTGKHRMPTYRGKLTDDQITEIAQYVKVMVGNETQKEEGVPK